MRLPLLMSVILLVVSIAVDAYIAYDIAKCTRRKIWTRVYCAVSVLCWLFLLVTVCLPKRSADREILTVMWMLYVYLSVYASKLVYAAVSLSGRLVDFIFRIRRERYLRMWLGLACAVCFGAVMWYGAAKTRYDIVVSEVEVSSDKIPAAFDGYRIEQISDLHTGSWGEDPSFLMSLVDSVNSLDPDLIVFTGDIVNRRTDELFPFLNVLAGLRAKDGVLSVLGNHDYGDYVNWEGPYDRARNNLLLERCQESMGWTLLDNRHISIARGNDSIDVIGVGNWGEPPFNTYGNLDKALSEGPDSTLSSGNGKFKVLLSHNPEHWNREVSGKTDIDLTLSGHTHAMQVVLALGAWKWSPASWRYPLWGGMYEKERENGGVSRLYVNIGAGQVGMPSRLLDAAPEITLLVLKSE